MNFDDAKCKLIFSKAYDKNYRKAPRINGYVSEAEFSIILENNVSRVARNNGLDSDYARFLAIAKSVGAPSDDAQEQNLLNGRVAVLEKILGEKLEDYVIEDIAYLNGEGSTATNEGKAVRAAQEVMEIVSGLTDSEKKELGGGLLEATLLDGIHMSQGDVVSDSFSLLEEIMGTGVRYS